MAIAHPIMSCYLQVPSLSRAFSSSSNHDDHGLPPKPVSSSSFSSLSNATSQSVSLSANNTDDSVSLPKGESCTL